MADTAMPGATADLDHLADQIVALAELNSGSHHPEGVDRVGERFCELVAELAPEQLERPSVEPTPVMTAAGTLDERPVGHAVVASKRPESPFQVLLFGHLDTVFGPESAFQSVERHVGHRLTGPGVADCKGGLVTAVEVLRRVEAAPWGDQIGWCLAAVPDEEVGSHGSRPLLAGLAESCHLGLGFEPALPSGGVAGARKGTLTGHLVVRGRSAHVGRAHHEGRSAIVALSRLIIDLESHNAVHAVHGASARAAHDAVPGGTEDVPPVDPATGITINCGRISGGGALNAVPELAVGSFNIRVETPEDHSRAVELFERAVDDAGRGESGGIDVELHWTGARPPKVRDPALSGLLDDLASVASEAGVAMTIEDTGGCCDGNDLAAAGLVNVDSLGIRGGGIHSSDEFALVDSVPERADLATRLIERRLRVGVPR